MIFIKTISCEESRIFNVFMFPTWTIDIDFKSPKLIQNDLVNITNQVEKQCPVAKYFDVNGIGEGVVWSYLIDPNTKIRFKVKGQKHSVTKTKSLAPVDIEKVKSITEFVNITVTEQRLEQAIECVFTQTNTVPSNRGLKDFIVWITKDIDKEESDTLEKNNITLKEVSSLIACKARTWFMEKYN